MPLSLVRVLTALVVLAVAKGQRSATCDTQAEAQTVSVSCEGAASNAIVGVSFANFGTPTGVCPAFQKGSCGTDLAEAVAKQCVGENSCDIFCTDSLDRSGAPCCIQGKGECCGCNITTAGKPYLMVALPDPCPGQKKSTAVAITCNNTRPAGAASAASLRVNALDAPNTIDDATPRLTWQLLSESRGILQSAYQVQLSKVTNGPGGAVLLFDTGKVSSNVSFHHVTSATPLVSDSLYHWRVRAYAPNATDWADATFSTALLEQTDWAASDYIQAPGPATGDTAQMASEMRKEFFLPSASKIHRARAFVALPGFGTVSVNGQRVDGEAGTRMLSQYDVRMLYHTYDIAKYLRPGEMNVIGIYAGLGWWGHPAVPPQKTRFPFGPPTVRAVVTVTGADNQTGTAQTVTVGTDGSWTQTQVPHQTTNRTPTSHASMIN
jgi:hypothetical protein